MISWRSLSAAIGFGVVFLGSSPGANARVLFDASLGSPPSEQGWAFLTNPVFGAVSDQQVEGGVLTLDSSKVLSEQAGYFSAVPSLGFVHENMPIMDLAVGPTLIEFAMRQAKGEDLPDTDAMGLGERNRGGFALIVIGEDAKGIELQFRADAVVALDDTGQAFPIGEVAEFDTTTDSHAYRLKLTNEGYHLLADGQSILGGRLRDYSGVAPSPPFDFPYTTPSFVFWGDDTGRAGAITELTRLEISLIGDCSQDSTLDASDLSCVASIEARDVLLRSLGTQVGDLDGSGAVDFDDFLTLSMNFGAVATGYEGGDIDLSGEVAFADFLILAANSAGSPDASFIVPEPASRIALLVSFMLAMVGVRALNQRASPCGP